VACLVFREEIVVVIVVDDRFVGAQVQIES